ncbi:NapC/NirT family cytochrome c [Tropicibacter sp. R15_0]|uniref:NapC/NirT family cytochrome c n=1 Tax=Tropicibacter sp. R15_0 TaxID=2821101 RepID=UPI001AD96A19|nr:NapC/NirT family cytochrome c [Tropicibacter sp. R15_0]MBO9465348.1 NapC/NirT family cytochrome c [Tropicibacter sp. R15_0]
MSDQKPGLFNRFFTPSAVYSFGGILIGGFIAGIVFWGGFNWTLEMTNTEEFCVSCHEMEVNVYAEYQGTIHQNNGSGVRATCPDCHVPKDWTPKIIRKIQASKELYGHFITHVVDTPEKFAEHRAVMASREWARMKRTDSKECRNCHNFDYMDFTMQETRAAENHQKAIDEGKTCIDCHQGIAHDLPSNYLEHYEKVVSDLDDKGLPPPAQGTRFADGAAIRAHLSDQ